MKLKFKDQEIQVYNYKAECITDYGEINPTGAVKHYFCTEEDASAIVIYIGCMLDFKLTGQEFAEKVELNIFGYISCVEVGDSHKITINSFIDKNTTTAAEAREILKRIGGLFNGI